MIVSEILVGSCLVSAFISCAIGVYVLAKNPASTINRLFFATMIGASYWAVGEFLIWMAPDREGVFFWLKFSAFWPFVIAVTAQFLYALTASMRKIKANSLVVLGILYIPALFLSFIGLFSDYLYTVTYREGTGWIYVPAENSPLNTVVSVYIIAVMIWAACLTVITWYHARDEKNRRQILPVSIGIAVAIVFGILAGVIFPAYGIYVPNVLFIGIVIFSLLMAHSMVRYDLFCLTPETAAHEILRLMPDGLILVDPGCRIMNANPAAARIFCVRVCDMPGKPVEDFIPGPACEEIRAVLQKTGDIFDREIILNRNEYRVISVSGSTVRSPSGEDIGTILIMRDITLRKTGEASLKLANEKISKLSQITRHDISNLVTALAGYHELLRMNEQNTENSAYLSSCVDLVDKISKHLQFSREYQEIGIHKPDWQDLRGITGGALQDLPKNHLPIGISVAPVEVYSDPLIRKVFYNLLENARRHGAHISRIDVGTREEPDGTLVLIVEDDGVGIKNEDKERIFQYGCGDHTGLGLAISRDILSMTGISIAETGTEGRGARFEIRVPPGAWRRAVPATAGN